MVGNTHALASLTTGTGTIVINNSGGSASTGVATSGSTGQVYNGAVTLGADLTLAAGSGNPIDFTSTLDSASSTARNLILTGSGTETFNGMVGNTFALASLTTGTGTIVINNSGGSASTGVATSGSAGQVYNGAVTLGADLTFDTTSGGAVPAGANITFNSTLGNSASHAVIFAAGTSGAISVTGTTGNSTALSSLTINSSNGAVFTGAVNVSGATNLNNTQTGQLITFTGGLTANSLVTANKGYNLLLGGGTSITSAVNLLNIGTDTLGNTGTLTFVGGLATTGNTSNPGTVNVNGTVQTNGNALNLGAITLTGNSALATNHTVAAGASLNVGTITGGGFSLTLNSGTSGVITLNGIISGLTSLTATGNTTITNNITTSGALGQVYNSPVSISADVTLASGLGPINFTSTLDSFNAQRHVT